MGTGGIDQSMPPVPITFGSYPLLFGNYAYMRSTSY